jgi:hypothetical protein
MQAIAAALRVTVAELGNMLAIDVIAALRGSK